jgi:uncharacterized protein
MYIISDHLYGQARIDEPVLLELLQSAPLERLRGIHQAGASYLVRDGGEGISRYDHSVGVMLLIRLLGGSLSEQVAGLLHDVSHTAFSHVIDYALERRDEDYHEQCFERLVKQSAIPEILSRHQMSSTPLFALEQWPLLEQPAPDLCADRIDYTLRELFSRQFITHSQIQRFLSALAVYEKRIITTKGEAALWFTRIYSRLVSDIFLHPLETFADYQLAGALRVALKEGILQEKDLFLEDEQVLHMLHAAHHPEIERYVATLHPHTKVVEDEHAFTVHTQTKTRLVDPLVLTVDGQLIRCSELEPAIKQIHQEIIAKTSKGLFLRLASTM